MALIGRRRARASKLRLRRGRRYGGLTATGRLRGSDVRDEGQPGKARLRRLGIAMCFSATADLAAGVVVSAIGVDALRHARLPSQWLLASLPVVLAVHEIIEAFVWWRLEGHVSAAVGRFATMAYLILAFGVLPVLVPAAVGALEPRPVGRRMVVFIVLGAAVACVLLYSVLRGPVVTTIQGHHISYEVDLYRGGILVALYVMATCGSLLASNHRHVRWFGVVNLVVVVALVLIDKTAFISLWCAWAALTSVCIALHLRHFEPRPGNRRHLDAAVDRPSTGAIAI